MAVSVMPSFLSQSLVIMKERKLFKNFELDLMAGRYYVHLIIVVTCRLEWD